MGLFEVLWGVRGINDGTMHHQITRLIVVAISRSRGVENDEVRMHVLMSALTINISLLDVTKWQTSME